MLYHNKKEQVCLFLLATNGAQQQGVFNIH